MSILEGYLTEHQLAAELKAQTRPRHDANVADLAQSAQGTAVGKPRQEDRLPGRRLPILVA